MPPPTPATALTDRAALHRRRIRAARNPALFLHEAAAAELQERLTEVNRVFTRPALIAPPQAPFARLWREALPSTPPHRQPGLRTVADDDVLALEPDAHDLVVHALCLHWASDPVGQLIQCRRALRPDGLFLAVLFGGQTLAELRACLAEAEVALCGGLSPRVLPMAEIRDLGALLQRAGFALPVADSVPFNVSYRDMPALMHDLRAMGESNAMAARPRSFATRALFEAAARLYATRFPAQGGRISASFEMVWLTGWAPAESQPRPLRPGSAKVRLADALGTQETPLADTPPRSDNPSHRSRD